jgi:hypothetical protein
MMEINGEKDYQIWSWNVYWIQDMKPEDRENEWSKRDMELYNKNRLRSSSGSYCMYKDDKTKEEVEAEAKKWWDEFSSQNEKIKGLNPELEKIEVEFIRNEVWCGGWFHHWTFDVGKSDVEVLRSFSDFVERMQVLNERERYKSGKDVEAYCLMGAEDRWRWHGKVEKSSDEGDTHTAPPCRCEGCKKNGVVRICH